jgi:predicted transcriptional regulator with HTH domain
MTTQQREQLRYTLLKMEPYSMNMSEVAMMCGCKAMDVLAEANALKDKGHDVRVRPSCAVIRDYLRQMKPYSMTRNAVMKVLGCPSGTLGYVTSEMREQGEEVLFARSKGPSDVTKAVREFLLAMEPGTMTYAEVARECGVKVQNVKAVVATMRRDGHDVRIVPAKGGPRKAEPSDVRDVTDEEIEGSTFPGLLKRLALMSRDAGYDEGWKFFQRVAKVKRMRI